MRRKKKVACDIYGQEINVGDYVIWHEMLSEDQHNELFIYQVKELTPKGVKVLINPKRNLVSQYKVIKASQEQIDAARSRNMIVE